MKRFLVLLVFVFVLSFGVSDHAHFDTERVKSGVVWHESYRDQESINDDWYISNMNPPACPSTDPIFCEAERSGVGFYSSVLDGAVLPFYANEGGGQLRECRSCKDSGDSSWYTTGDIVYVQFEIRIDSTMYDSATGSDPGCETDPTKMCWNNGKLVRIYGDGLSSDAINTLKWVGWSSLKDEAWISCVDCPSADGGYVRLGQVLTPDKWMRATVKYDFASATLDWWFTDPDTGVTNHVLHEANMQNYNSGDRVYGVAPMSSSSDRDGEDTSTDPDILNSFRNIIVSEGLIAFDSSSPCTSDGDCLDSNPCNGIETCDLGSEVCQSGTPVVVDDGVSCTIDSCDPGTGVVSHNFTPCHAHFDAEKVKSGVEYYRSWRTQAEIDADWWTYDGTPSGYPAVYYNSTLDGAMSPVKKDVSRGALGRDGDFGLTTSDEFWIQYEMRLEQDMFDNGVHFNNMKLFRLKQPQYQCGINEDRLLTYHWLDGSDQIELAGSSGCYNIGDNKLGVSWPADTWIRTTLKMDIANDKMEMWMMPFSTGVTSKIADLSHVNFPAPFTLTGAMAQIQSTYMNNNPPSIEYDHEVGYRNLIVSRDPIALGGSTSGVTCSQDLDCDDSNDCTDDVCLDAGTSGSSCQNTDNANSCDDGDACTVSDVCSAGVCGGGSLVTSCVDGDGCCPGGCDENSDADCIGICGDRVAHYSFDSDASDGSGGGHDGVLNGPVSSSGNFGGAFDFDGVDDRIEVSSFNLAGDEMSISLWAFSDGYGSYDRFISKAVGSAEQDHYFMLSNDGGRFRFRLKAGGSTSTLRGEGLQAGVWQHLVGVYDGSEMKVFIDGVLVGSTSKSGDIDSGDVAVWIGMNPNLVDAFDGRIDEVLILDRALSDSEVLDLFGSGAVSCGGSGGFHEADLDTSGKIEFGEANAYIGLWLSGSRSISDLLAVVNLWRWG